MQILPETCRGKSFQLICGASIILMSKSGISIIGKESYRLMFLIKKDTNISSKMLTNWIQQYFKGIISSVQFSGSVVSTLCDPMNRSTPGLTIPHQLPEFTQTHVHRVSDAIQPSHPLSSPSPPAPNHSKHEGLFKWVNSSHQVAKVLEFQLQNKSFQWTPRTDLL